MRSLRSPSKAKAKAKYFVKTAQRVHHVSLKTKAPDRLTGVERRLARAKKKGRPGWYERCKSRGEVESHASRVQQSIYLKTQRVHDRQ